MTATRDQRPNPSTRGRTLPLTTMSSNLRRISKELKCGTSGEGNQERSSALCFQVPGRTRNWLFSKLSSSSTVLGRRKCALGLKKSVPSEHLVRRLLRHVDQNM